MIAVWTMRWVAMHGEQDKAGAGRSIPASSVYDIMHYDEYSRTRVWSAKFPHIAWKVSTMHREHTIMETIQK